MKMKNYTIIVSIIFAFSVANTLADGSFEVQDVCTIKSNFHKNLAGIVTNDVSIQLFNELRQITHDVCMDPKAHDSLVLLLDSMLDVLTNPNVSEMVGASFHWIRTVIKNKNFRDIWYENVKGLNMWFENEPITSPLTDTLFDNLTKLLNDPLFDSTFERVVGNMGSLLKAYKDVLYKTGALVTRPLGGRRTTNKK